MSFTQWRQQVRILEGLRRLAREEPVTTVALDLGYDSPSAFIAMFRKALGRTPGQYFEAGALTKNARNTQRLLLTECSLQSMMILGYF
jgi:AraC-like DNA-binding protein